MHTDTKTLFTAAFSIFASLIAFELGKNWALIGSLNIGPIFTNTSKVIGAFLIYCPFLFAVVFVGAVILIAGPSRELARQSLVVSAALGALPFLFIGCGELIVAFDFPKLPYPSASIVMLAGLYGFCYGVHGAFRGFPEQDKDENSSA